MFFFFIILDHKDINDQLRQKSLTSCRRNERCQRPKTSWLFFVFPFAFKNKHRFENFFSFIMEGMGTLWLFKFELSQYYRNVTAIISHNVPIFLLNTSEMKELVNFIFHIMKIFKFRHRLALSMWCVFKFLQYTLIITKSIMSNFMFWQWWFWSDWRFLYTEDHWKVRKWTKISNLYNQAPHLTQDTNGKVTTSQLGIAKESQEKKPF